MMASAETAGRQELDRQDAERFRLLADHLSGVFWTMEFPGPRITYVSPAFELLWGMDRDALYADRETWVAATHPEDAARVQAAFEALSGTGRFDVEYRIATPSGVRWVHDRAYPVMDGAGVLQRIVGFAEDVTPRRIAEIERDHLFAMEHASRTAAEAAGRDHAAALALVDTILMAMPAGCAFFDRELRFARVNEALAALNGASVAEHLGRTLAEVVPEMAASQEPLIRGVLEGGPPIVDREISGETPAHPGAERYWLVSYYPVPGEDGAPRGVGAIIVDITQRKRIEETLRLTTERFELAVHQAPVVVFNQDRQLRYTWISNPPPGMTVESAVSGTDDDLFPPDEAAMLIDLKRAVIASGVGKRQEVRVTVGGIGLVYDLRVEPLLNAAGDVTGITCAAVDITAQRALERVQDDLLASISHDLLNPLAAIRGNAQLLRRRVTAGQSDPPSLLTGIERVEELTDRMEAMIAEPVDVARLRGGHALQLEVDSTDLVTLVQSCVDEYQALARGHRIDLDARVDRLVGVWDARRLTRVLDNLLTNAIKYSPDGGPIGVSVDVVADTAGTPWAELRVSDAGVGIPPLDLPHIFERFRRGTNVDAIGGAGIGLAGARRVVEQHGGTIEGASEVGQGSTFTVRLPLRPPLTPSPGQ